MARLGRANPPRGGTHRVGEELLEVVDGRHAVLVGCLHVHVVRIDWKERAHSVSEEGEEEIEIEIGIANAPIRSNSCSSPIAAATNRMLWPKESTW